MAETVLDISRDIFQTCRVYDRVHQVPFLHDSLEYKTLPDSVIR